MKKDQTPNPGRTQVRWLDSIRLGLFLSVLAAGMEMTGCDYTFDPLDEGEGLYSIYGVMDLDENIHQFRVKDLNRPVTPEGTREIDFTVTLENLDSGEQQVLEDSVMEYTGLFYTHNFFSTMEVLPSIRYAIHVNGSEGSVSATTTSPVRTTAEENNVNKSCSDEIRVVFHPVPDPDDFKVEAGFQVNDRVHWIGVPIEEQTPPDEWIASFIPEEVFDASLYFHSCASLDHSNIYVRYTHYSAGLFENLQSESYNVPGGIGRFGALYTELLTIPTVPG